jgi:acyl carrier protein
VDNCGRNLNRMNSEQVPFSLRNILADVLEISPEEVTPDLNIGMVDNWDSFRHLQAMLAVEGEYGVQFDPQRIPELTSVSLIQAELEKKGATL